MNDWLTEWINRRITAHPFQPKVAKVKPQPNNNKQNNV